MSTRLPIIYVRGFAGGQNDIDEAVDDPLYGFNKGSTHVRVGQEGKPHFYQYEGPLVRLLTEDDYSIRVRGGQQQQLLTHPEKLFSPEHVWVYRFYDRHSRSFGEPDQRFNIEQAAQGLADFIDLVRSKTKGKPPVLLVAHSMGGLISRIAIERFIHEPATAVSKLCTIGTNPGGPPAG